MRIIYYADNASMGYLSDAECDKFRAWAKKQIENEYPDADVSVENKPSLNLIHTDFDDLYEEVYEFCHRLWDRCDIW